MVVNLEGKEVKKNRGEKSGTHHNQNRYAQGNKTNLT